MTATSALIAEAIRAARRDRGLSQTELAERLDRTQTAVSYWESGKRTPGIDDLLEIAGVLAVPVSALLPPDDSSRPTPALLRATAERLADSDLESAIEELVEHVESLPSFPSATIQVTASAPSNAANELLEKAGVEDPPVEVEELAELCGVLVCFKTFPDSLSGLFFTIDDAAVVGINAAQPPTRRRFSLAHELGHFLLGHHRGLDGRENMVHIDSAEGNAPNFDWRGERGANEFAAELLMPRRLVSREYEATDSPQELASIFEVSELAMGYRLVNLGLR